MPFVADIPGAVERGFQMKQNELLRPIKQETAQLELDRSRQQLAFGELKQKSLQQQIDARSDEQKNKEFVFSALRIKNLPDNQKLDALLKQEQDILANRGDATDTQAGIQAAQEGRFEELNKGLDSILQAGVQQGIISGPDKLSPLQQKVQAEGIDPNSKKGFARAKELNQRAATDPSLKPTDQQILKSANEGQLAAAGFANRVNAANANLDEIESIEGFDPTSIQAAFFGAVPGGNIVLSDDQQRYSQAKRDFITAVLRKESGAVIGKDEFINEDKKFFPQVGDKPGVLKQKAAGRKRAFENLKNQSKGVFKVQFDNPQVFTGDISDMSDEDIKKALGL